MAAYTILDKEEIKTIVSQYAIGSVHTYSILSGGSENTNYGVITTDGSYVLTVCEQKSIQKATELAHLLEHLEAHNFSTSKVVRDLNQALITMWNDKPILLKEYLKGNILEDFPNHLLTLLGKELGKLHQIEAPEYLPKDIAYGMEYFEEVQTYSPDSLFGSWLKDIKKMVQKQISSPLPKTLVHSDIFYSNVIVGDDGNSVVIMDFEEASYYYRIFDLGMMIIGLCSKGEAIDLAKVGHILKGYQEEVQLLDVEKDSLKLFTIYAAAGTAFWRHKHFTYVKPDSAMSKHYLHMKNIADSIRTLPDDCFKKLLNS